MPLLRVDDGQYTLVGRFAGMHGKRFVKFLSQAAISGLLVCWLLHNYDLPRQLQTALAEAGWPWLIAAFLVYGCVELLGAIRWHFLLRHFGFRLPVWDGVRVLLIGIFFNTLLPGLVAGDGLRAAYLGRRFPHQRLDAILVVVMERVFGLLGLITVGVVMIEGRFHWLHQSVAAGALSDLSMTVLGLGAAGIALPMILRRSFPNVAYRFPWLRTALSADGLSASGFAIAVIFAATIVAHLCYATSFYCTGRAFASIGTAATFVDMLTVTPIVNTFTSLPISVAGLGVRESTFVVLLRDLCGVPPAAAMLIGSFGFAIRALWAILGCALLAGCRRLEWNEWTSRIFGRNVEIQGIMERSSVRPDVADVGRARPLN